MKKLLVVDDKEELCHFTELNLRMAEEFSISICADEVEAIKRAKVLRPDLILLNILLPGVSAATVAKHLKGDRTTRKIPIVLITTAGTENKVEDKKALLGADYVITKPISTEKLVDLINQVNTKMIKAKTKSTEKHMKLTLKLAEGPEAGRVFEFDEADTFLVGRSPMAHLQFDRHADRRISRIHFVMEVRPPKCIITDMGSTNGTYVNEEKITQAELKDGDQIRIGVTKIDISIDTEAEREVRVLCAMCNKDVTEELEDQTSPREDQALYVCRQCSAMEAERCRVESEAKAATPPARKMKRICSGCGASITSEEGPGPVLLESAISLYMCPECISRATTPDLPAIEIGDYHLLSEVGRGRMGVVYQAVHNQSNRLCAIKRIHPEAVQVEMARRLFLREVVVQAAIRHPNLMPVIDQGEADGACYFVMDYMEGGDVESLITNRLRGPLAPELACSIIAQVLRGIQTVHDKGHIHRGLKPSNLLLDRRELEGDFVVKVSDCGMAKAFEFAGNSVVTNDVEFAGTLMFMPPEQMTEYRYLKPLVDVYAAGVCLYYMLSAKYSVDFPTPLDRAMPDRAQGRIRNPLELVVEHPPIQIQQRVPDIPQALAIVVDKAVQKDVNERFHTAESFMEAIERVMQMEDWHIPKSL